MPLVIGRYFCLALVPLAAACVPNDDSSKTQNSQPPTAVPPAPKPVPKAVPPRPPRPAHSTTPAPSASVAASASAAPGPASDLEAVISERFVDNFDRAQLGPEYLSTSPVWRIQNGRLCGQDAKNHGVWLKRRLPVNARIEFDATSASPDGDLKVEVWGDGHSYATATSYTNASSYVVIFGGWKNQFHVLARIDEHAPNRPQVKVDPDGALNARPVVPNQSYHFKVERTDGKTIRWFVDDIEIISFTDPEPMKGTGHQHMGFNDWAVPVCFDNLQITPLGGS